MLPTTKAYAHIGFLIVGLLIAAFILFMPIPHYSANTGWYQGPSIAGRLLGETQKGAPIEQVYWTVFRSSVETPYSIFCQEDSDCTKYTVLNQCKIYCGNNDTGNSEVSRRLENNRVCDTGSWKKPAVDCRCVLSRCINIAE